MRMYIAFQVFSLSLCKINKENRKYVYETPEKNIRSTCIKQMSCITTVNYVWRKKNFRQSFYRICVSLSNGLALIRDEQIRERKLGSVVKKKHKIYTHLYLFSLQNLWAVLSSFWFQLCYLPFHAYFSLSLSLCVRVYMHVWKTFCQQHIYQFDPRHRLTARCQWQ